MFSAEYDAGYARLQAHQRHDVYIFTFGAVLNRFALFHQGHWHNVIAAYADEHDARARITERFASAKLSPFACRLKHGHYHFNGTDYHTGSHHLNGHAIHGLLYNAEFAVTRIGSNATGAWVELSHDYTGNINGYPFPYRITVRYELNENGLTLCTEVQNHSNQPMPLADGWHPYFTLGGQADDWTLQLNAKHRLQFDNDLLPTGNRVDDTRFTAPASLQNAELDHCFILANHDTPACVLQNNLYRFSISPDASYPFMQVYLPPQRDSIALENLSGAPDCFNNGIGLITLPAGASHRFSTVYQLQHLESA
ncbi:aldose 1-epimerase [Conchiformibius steedae DSM 2580]|uniref:Aldose 1-epimerase n=1 Tax=Conchiformibius steedae DSM 2580 TaxID=1121352 RepID=A0AAE9HXV6_9NEIS|nr:aldose 1-epimerase [Conchiformibius steedae]QMT34348.1 aldose 1-epimerase [Conchiformibius steedae]URD67126.1 aldose 1-epimerase [Conchiformibius steedae DSM 2580]